MTTSSSSSEPSSRAARGRGPAIDAVAAAAYRIPTDGKESDGTLEWDHTTMVVVEVSAGGKVGLGYTYAHESVRSLVESLLRPVIVGASAFDAPAVFRSMQRAVRNQGAEGLCAMAISAVDVALWDLHARLLDVPLVSLFGAARPSVEAYGSDGFTSSSIDELAAHMKSYAEAGFTAVKMKVGREPTHDVARVRAARRAVGDGVRLFVDANGAWDRKQALRFASRFALLGVSWLEEPVPSSDVDGLRFIRERAPPKMDVAAGEYAWNVRDARALLEAGAVDVLQADVTRCGGFTGFRFIDAACSAFATPLSGHCAPALALPACCAATSVRHTEYFYDHARIETMLFDGAVQPSRGRLAPDLDRPGHGLTLKRDAARRFAVAGAQDDGSPLGRQR